MSFKGYIIDNPTPVVIFHGHGVDCPDYFVNYISAKMNTYAVCIEPSPDPKNGSAYSKFTGIVEQSERS